MHPRDIVASETFESDPGVIKTPAFGADCLQVQREIRRSEVWLILRSPGRADAGGLGPHCSALLLCYVQMRHRRYLTRETQWMI